MRTFLTVSVLALVMTGAQAQQATPAQAGPDPEPTPASRIARAKPLELNTPYVAPPGEPLVHHAAGFAKVMFPPKSILPGGHPFAKIASPRR